MRISAKGRYAIATMICLVDTYKNEEFTTVISISERLDISKIYLEQVFSLLKRGGLVISTKGARGGYRLSRDPDEITAYDILEAIETTLFENSKEQDTIKIKSIERAMNQGVFDQLHNSIVSVLKTIVLSDLHQESLRNEDDEDYMFFI